MILIGAHMEWFNCAGDSYEYVLLNEAEDVHEAAAMVVKYQYSNPWQCRALKNGEFHDVSTRKTWSIDSGGHTLRDYRTEMTYEFKKRWKDKERRFDDLKVQQLKQFLKDHFGGR